MRIEAANNRTQQLDWPRIGETCSLATTDDVGQIHSILSRATEWLQSQGMNHWNGVHNVEAILRDFPTSDVLIVRDSKSQPIATVTISYTVPWYHKDTDMQFWADPEAGAAYVRKLSVVPEYLKQGMGTLLLSLAEQLVCEKKLKYARLDTNPAFPALKDYYSNRGYSKRGERDGSSYFEKSFPSS